MNEFLLKIPTSMLRTLLAFSLLMMSLPIQAQWQDAKLDWQLKRDRNDIKVFLSKVPNSKFRAVLSIMELKADAKQLAALVMDLENCPNWASMCKSAEVFERVSANEVYVYSVNDAPFPVRDRDIVAHVTWLYDQKSGKITMRSDATPDKLPKKKGLVRVRYASSEWHFTPTDNDTVLVENYAHVDPNGRVPAWLINFLIIESPFKTLKNMRRLILDGQYSDAEIVFAPNTAVEPKSERAKAKSIVD